MFENIIGQDVVRDQLKRALEKKNLPRAILFTGEPYAGKLTTAMELARAITCRKDAFWECDCKACRSHRMVVNPDMVILGNRYFISEIKASADLLVRTRALFAQFMFIRNIRKLLKRFEPMIWEGMEKKLSRYTSSLSRLSENLEILDPGRELPPDEDLQKVIDDTVSLARNLVPAVPGTIPVDQIRNLSKWAHHTSSGTDKIIILEEVDKLQESGSNSLLKILEEPPAHVTFILTAERKGNIIPTILSRVRVFDFKPRTPEISHRILQKLYRIDQEKITLREHFQEWSDLDYSFLKGHVRNFLDAAFTRGSITDLDDLFQFMDNNRDKSILRTFLELLSGEIHMRFREDPELNGTVSGQTLLKEVLKEINSSHVNSEVFNQNSLFLLECLFYKTRDIYEAFC